MFTTNAAPLVPALTNEFIAPQTPVTTAIALKSDNDEKYGALSSGAPKVIAKDFYVNTATEEKSGFLCCICVETNDIIRVMTQKQALQLFNDRQIRIVWDDKGEKWYFSIVDVVAALTDSPDPAKYWRVLKSRLKKEGDETATNCSALKMLASDGKMRMTDVADQVQLFRLIQSIPSPKAESFKVWMAQVASERVDEIQDPELAIDRGY